MSVWTEEAGWAAPRLCAAVPGPASVAAVDTLARHESPGITARRARAGEARGVGRDPIVWDRALGANVWDLDDNRYVDLTAAFGVALIGHRHPEVVAAIEAQAGRLLHGMGDVYPNGPRINLMARLAALAPADLDQCILAASGAEAVEAALKTAALASGKGHHVAHLPFGCDLDLIDRLLTGPATGGEEIGAILVEPIQGRGGFVVAPPGWLAGLRRLCDAHGVVLVFDEIYTGLGRTGTLWAGDHEGVVPDVLAVGKALAGGMPIGACVARTSVMAAWQRSVGEAIHTSTFLGHPVTAAAALATLDVMAAMDVPAAARRFEAQTRARFGDRVRGRGGMLGLALSSPGAAAKVTGRLLKAGYIALPGGVRGDVLGLTPPLMLGDAQREAAFDAIARAIDQVEEADRGAGG